MERDATDAPDRVRREYRLERCLGRGGFGEVYLARVRTPGGLEHEVAVKLLKTDVDPESQAIQRLRDEGILLSMVKHPVLLVVHDLLVLGGHLALVTEYVDGQDLRQAIEDRGDPLPMRALVDVVGQVADALDAAWTAKSPEGEPLRIVHRDVKPSNVRIGRHGTVKLLDFGLARTDALTREARTATNTMLGSLPYMAPERFTRSEVEPASDVFALGCVLYEGVTHMRLFQHLDTPATVGLAHSKERFDRYIQQRIDELPAGLDPGVRQLLEDALRHESERRPTAAEFSLRCTGLDKRLPDPGLREWCRARRWPEPAAVAAPMTGQVLSEATIRHPEVRPPNEPETTWHPVPPKASSSPPGDSGALRARWWLPAAFVGLAAVATLGLAAVLTVIAVSRTADHTEKHSVVQPPPQPTAPEPAAITPAPGAPEPTHRGTAPRGRPVAVEAVVVPTPAEGASLDDSDPQMTVAVEPPPGRVEVDGDRAIELRLGELTLTAPGEIAPGRYEIWADLGSGNKRAGAVDVQAGETIRIGCNAIRAECGRR